MSNLDLTTPEDWLVTSHSIDGTFDSCPRRFEFRHVIGMIPDTDQSGWASDIGTAMHEAVQEWTRERDRVAGLFTLLKWWPWQLEDARMADPNQAKDYRRSLGQAILLYERIIGDPFWDDWEPAILPDGVHAIELPFRVNHVSLGTFIHPQTGKPTGLATQGKIDWILRNRKTGQLGVADLKTTTLDEPAQDAQFRFSGQAAFYGMVLSSSVGHDWHTHGIDTMYLVAEFGELAPEFRVVHHHLDGQEVADAVDVKLERLERMMTMCQRAHFHRRTHGCTFFQQPCAYLDVCNRRDMKFLKDWFANESERFIKQARIYEPYWLLEA